MRLISWNGAARTKLLERQVAALGDRQPDIVAMQEVREPAVERYLAALRAIDLPYAADSFRLSPDRTSLTGARCYGEVFAARWPLRALPPSTFAIPWPERVLSCVAETPWMEIELHTAHIPPGVSNEWIKIETLRGIYQRLVVPSTIPRILCGDFNTPQEETSDGEVITWGQRRRPDGSVVYREDWGEEWDQGERDVIAGLAAYDLPDVFRLLRGYKTQEFSWYWRGKDKGIGRRFDHVFASRSLNPVGCWYLHDLRDVDQLSDHAPIEVDFMPTPGR
jgi:exonuclease III